ncbi:DUF3048 domain-containing protein [Naasia lichenicola]|uniref:DUF3048 domain-containing protein n=1 Tax=Naasia lichenicola TaxID=2565933 RepID=UPI00130D6F21|nr:DUF3048 domain-containing protein [Naasia lichenicola]
MRRAFLAGALSAGASILLASCSVPEVSAAPATTPTPAPTPEFVSSYVAPAATELAPLRGTSVLVGSLARPSIAAKIDNHEEARPQFGLERADIVFEELVEGGLTRYLAVWHSDLPDQLGPVRSIRPMDPDIASPYGGIICYSGGQEIFVDMMEATNVYNAIHGSSDTDETFFRTDLRDAPHNVLVMAPAVVGQHVDLAPPAQQWAYSADALGSSAVREGTPSARIDVVYSSERYPSWQWDDAAKRYLRSQEGAPDLDLSGAQLAATNVIVMSVAIDGTYGPVPKTVMVGSGQVWVSTGGSTIHGTWSKADQLGAIRLVDDRGMTIRLAAGSTWVQLLPQSGTITLSA